MSDQHAPTASASDLLPQSPWYRRIGPGLITACVVIGPGSIITSSRVGAAHGYDMLWIVAVAVGFMMLYMNLGARLGAVADASPCQLIRRQVGGWLSVLVGLSVFFIAAAFQSGNNIGVASAFESFVEDKRFVVSLVVLLNGLALVFLFAFRNIYRVLERLMMALVGIMLVSFAINLIGLKPDPGSVMSGFWPKRLASGDTLPVLGLVGTTFVSAAAFYQAYLVRQKGWTQDNLRTGMLDARIGSIIMLLITVMLMSTSAAAFAGREDVSLSNPVEIAKALESTFGPQAQIIFCLGLFSAAYSSFLVNAMIGGYLAADGLGLAIDERASAPRWLTAAGLVVGMLIGIAVIAFDFDRTPTVIVAQAVTVVVAPLIAGILLWLTASRSVMGDQANGRLTNIMAGIGLLMLIAIATKTAVIDLPEKIRSYASANEE